MQGYRLILIGIGASAVLGSTTSLLYLRRRADLALRERRSGTL